MKKIVLIPIVLMFLLSSCYDDYKLDFDYTATYFALQSPLRTLIVQDGKDELSMEVGVVLAGVYENKANEVVNFEVRPTLLANYPQLTLLPADYYTISNPNQMDIPKDQILGKVTITLNEKFINDPKAHLLNYALPLKITGTTLDSILAGKDSTIIAIKYQNKYYGAYWVKGVDHTLNTTGQIASSFKYSNADLVKNTNKLITTLAKDSCSVPYIGADLTGANKLKLQIKTDGSVTIIPGVLKDMTNISGTGQYDKTKKVFTLDYSYTKTGVQHHVLDTLYHFDSPLKVEKWQ
jgi:hypothetical protein